MYISVIRKPVPMLKSTRAFCKYIIILYTTGYNPSRAAICTLYFAMATFHFRRFPRFSWFSLLSVVLSESVACRRRWLRRWRRRRRDVDVSISMSIISAVDECNACMRAARVERGAFLLPLLPIPVPSLPVHPSFSLGAFPLVRQRSSYANLLATVSRCFIKSCPKTTGKSKGKGDAQRLSWHL